MIRSLSPRSLRPLLAALLLGLSGACLAQAAAETEFKPYVGQAGKDVVWVPTPPELVEKMIDMLKLTPRDYVMDLGSGDGRNIIAAARRGVRALGVEYNEEMVKLAQKAAADAGVADKAKFVQGDMYEADISRATALALFLLPDNLRKLEKKFLALRPGTRIVVNTFGVPGWEPQEEAKIPECTSWCTAFLYVIPARVHGTWRLGGAELQLKQEFSKVSGTITANGVTRTVDGQLVGDRITLNAEGERYEGRVRKNAMVGTNGSRWNATRAKG